MKYLTAVTSFQLFSITAFAQSSLSTAGVPSPSPSLLVTTNGQCGAGVGMTCLGNVAPGGGQCCSSSGWCGSTPDYCDTGCQTEYGICGSSSMSSSAYSSVMLSSMTMSSLAVMSSSMSGNGAIPTPSGVEVVSPDGSCGGVNGYTCIGYGVGECCGPLGYCGSGPQYCMAGCQFMYGMCTNSNSSIVSLPMSSPSISTYNNMNGSWTSTATVTECVTCESMTSSASTTHPTRPTTLPSPYTGAAVPGRYMDAKSWVVAGFVGLLWIL